MIDLAVILQQKKDNIINPVEVTEFTKIGRANLTRRRVIRYEDDSEKIKKTEHTLRGFEVNIFSTIRRYLDKVSSGEGYSIIITKREEDTEEYD